MSEQQLPFGGPAAAAGSVYLVGGGPGDPGLLGLRAVRLLSTATVVAYDRLAPPEALSLCAEQAEQVYVGKLPDRHALSQDELNALLVDRARAGHAVVRLKGGDPFVLGRGSEEAQACVAAGVGFEVVPGVTAGVAAPAYAGIPVTHRGLAPGVAVATGHEDPTKDTAQVDYAALAAFPGTVVLYMAVGRLRAIAETLTAGGRPPTTPAALVRWGTTPRQVTVTATLADIADEAEAAGLSSPAVLVVGETVGLRGQLAWFDRRPLHGVAVLVPRTRHQASALSERLRARGAEPIEAPTIAVAAPADPEPLRESLRLVPTGRWDWIAFTSANGVEAVFSCLDELGADARGLAGARLAAVGPGTDDALRGHGLRADLVPGRSTTRALAEALVEADAPGRVLLPRADIATPSLTEALVAAGWQATEVEAYRTVRPPDLPDGVRERLRDGQVHVVAFASSSTVRNFVELLGEPPDPDLRVASIGPVTTETCHELGLAVHAEADPHDLDGLTEAVVAAVRA